MNSRQIMMDAIAGKQSNPTPIWFMRQAGRLFSDYRDLREDHDFKSLCQSPELNARVTCMPVERLDVDAAIIFSDILLPLESIGAGFELVPDKGPVLDQQIRTDDDVFGLSVDSPQDQLDYVYEAIQVSIDRLPDDVPLIGFAGAPFTLASYLIEGGRSRSLMRTRKFILNKPDAWSQLMEILVDVTIKYLEGQLEAGAEILQLFDSWVGQLSPPLYKDRILPYTREIFDHFEKTPFIHFGTKTAGILNLIDTIDPDVISLDWRIEIPDALNSLSMGSTLQGNLDPGFLLSNFDKIRPQVDRILEQAPSGHIFNLGHGILPDTTPDTVKKLVDYVHRETS